MKNGFVFLLPLLLGFLSMSIAAGPGTPWTRIDKNDVALLIIDHQLGLFTIVNDQTPVQLWSNVLAHAELGKIFGLPTVITSSAETGELIIYSVNAGSQGVKSSETTGPNGPIPEEILQLHPNATIVRRSGEVNAWDSEEFREAVKATGRKQVILAGITTDVCTAFAALSLNAEGYTVFANADASGALSKFNADLANEQMRAAGVHVLSLFTIASDLMRDWRATPGGAEMLQFYSKYFPSYGNLARVHAAAAAINNA
ncbi:hypothetical protein EST38_g6849 [Candolleomyces aberdarensis]|uniref:Isochorismatase-like domain-containing protein n=1 Tax=Candolleomyces aberdarensis TaxID=2316362 RepID=A0A4Q2DK00_9AGAR|nr:hypothetical protein EST38_g6849 [Candolleomyces aberdarensis]